MMTYMQFEQHFPETQHKTMLITVLFKHLYCKWHSRLSDVLPPLRSRVQTLYRTSDLTWEEFVNILPKVIFIQKVIFSKVGFLRVLRFLSTEKVDRVG